MYGTRKEVALYEAFGGGEAKRIQDGFEFIYTPKYGSWADMAKIELHLLMSHCVNQRVEKN